MRVYNGAAALLVRHCRPWQYCGFKTRSASCYYDILGVKKSATQQEIKSAYIQLSKKHHPDVSTHPNAQRQFTKVSEAYQVLGNPKSRRSYDNRFVSKSSLFTKAQRPENNSIWEEYSRTTYYRSNISEEEYFDVRRGIKFNQDDEETIMTPYRIFMDMMTVMAVLTVVIVFVSRHKESINNNLILPPSSCTEDIDQNTNKVSRERAKQLKYIKTVKHSEDMELENQ